MLPLWIIVPAIGVAGALVKGVISACSDSSSASSSSSSSSSSASTAASAAAEARRRNQQNLLAETVRCVHRHLDETIAATAKDFQTLAAAPQEAAHQATPPKPASGDSANILPVAGQACGAAAVAASVAVPLVKIRVTRADICQRLFNTTGAVTAKTLGAAIQSLQNDPEILWKLIAKEPLENLTLRQQAIEEEGKGLERLIHAWQNTVDKELS